MNKRKLMAILKLLAGKDRILYGPFFLKGDVVESIEVMGEDSFYMNVFVDNEYTSISCIELSKDELNNLLDVLIKILCRDE